MKEYDQHDNIVEVLWKELIHTPQSLTKDYVFHNHITKELATTMLNASYREDIMDTNEYQYNIWELFENIDEQMEVIDAYMTEFALRNEIGPWVYTPEMTHALQYVQHAKQYISQFIQVFKLSASKVDNEAQRDMVYLTYQQIMTILSNYIWQIEEYF